MNRAMKFQLAWMGCALVAALGETASTICQDGELDAHQRNNIAGGRHHKHFAVT
jgi:hypothetical protein